MSLFGALMGDLEEDPYFGSPRGMNRMINSFFSNPFEEMMGIPAMGFPALMGPPAMRRPRRSHEMMPFGFPNMDLYSQMAHMPQTMGDMHSFSSSTMVSMTTGPDGRPLVYQASSSTRTAPGGVRETKKTVADSRSGVKKMSIGHHIGERGHVIEREQNVFSGDQEERQEFINLEEEEAPTFNREWETKTRRATGGVSIEDVTDRPSEYRSDRHNTPLLALPSSSSTTTGRSRARASVSSTQPSATSSSSSHEKSRKRDHVPDGQPSSRRASKQQRSQRH